METLKEIILVTEVFCLTISFLQGIMPNKAENDKNRISLFAIICCVCAVIGLIILAFKWTDSETDPYLLMFSIAAIVYGIIYAIVKRKKEKNVNNTRNLKI